MSKKNKPSQKDKQEFLDFFLELLDSKNEDTDWYFTKGQARVLRKLDLMVPSEMKVGINNKYHHTVRFHVEE